MKHADKGHWTTNEMLTSERMIRLIKTLMYHGFKLHELQLRTLELAGEPPIRVGLVRPKMLAYKRRVRTKIRIKSIKKRRKWAITEKRPKRIPRWKKAVVIRAKAMWMAKFDLRPRPLVWIVALPQGALVIPSYAIGMRRWLRINAKSRWWVFWERYDCLRTAPYLPKDLER